MPESSYLALAQQSRAGKYMVACECCADAAENNGREFNTWLAAGGDGQSYTCLSFATLLES